MPDTPSRPVVLITGAARRIGRAMALDLAADGWTVALHHRSGRADAEALAAEIEETGGRALALAADLRDIAACRSLMSECIGQLGRVDCLINNASVFEDDSLRTMTGESWDAHLAVNLRAPVFLAQAFAEQPPERLATGNIVNIIDQRVWKLTPQFFSYTVAKAALWSATRTMAQSLAPRIRVNAIGPGPTLPSPRQSLEDFARQEAAVPLGHGATPEDICGAVRFILATPSMTGQMIALDGGQHIAWRTPDVTGSLE
jgi:NAD(P)-dependent dehydrogenase (short-subunit alcohol dehydrogenase family)